MNHWYKKVVPNSHSVNPPPSSSPTRDPAGTPENARHQDRDVELSETTPVSRALGPNPDVEAVTVRDYAPVLISRVTSSNFATGVSSSWTTSRTRSESSLVTFAQGIPSPTSALENEVTSSQRLTAVTAVPLSTAYSDAGSTIRSPSSTTSESVPAQTSTTSPVDIQSDRTTGIIIGSVFGGLAVLVIVSLAIVYVIWRKRRRRQGSDQNDREKPGQPRPSAEGERARPRDTLVTLPLQGATSPRTLRSQPIIADAISPVTPIIPHLSRWTSEKADIPSPADHHPAAVDIPPHLWHHPLFADTHYGPNNADVKGDPVANQQHEVLGHAGNVSPCSSSADSPPPRLPSPHPAGGFLFFPSHPSSQSSTGRPSTHDSSAPHTALSMPPPAPRRRHTRAGGQGGGGRVGGAGGPAARSRMGSGSSVSGGGGEAGSARPPSLPPPVPARNAARSKSTRDVERPTV